ncbi:MAG: putative metal-binding motif-containing protein [Myxococcota bacterium]
MNPPSRLTALAAALVLASCSSSPPSTTCQDHLDCPTGQTCEAGACVDPTNPPPDCTDGQTRPCGPEPVGACRKGTQRCVSGKFEATCTGAVQPASETCNSVDDDCDGEVDEGVGSTFTVDADGDGFGSNAPGAQTRVACSAPAGFVDNRTDCDDARAAVNPQAAEVCDAPGADEDCDGTANEGCSCTPGASQPCCAGRGTQTCDAVDGGTALSACSVSPSAETCNGVDDDCNGTVDDGATTGSPDGGLTLDGGVANPDGTCTVGVGVCSMLGTTRCASGVLSCSATPGTSSGETCNLLDDDCDGQVDEADPGLCPATGQACMSGTCVCSPGQSVCNGACVTLSAEVCDGQDNDCDGQVDETLTIACNTDADGDGYADGTSTTQQCPNTTRPQAGNCPVGFVAPASSQGADCDAMNGSRYRLVSSRTDGDGDGYCTGAASNDCAGATALPGRRFAASCAATDDCNDAAAARWQLASSRSDADADGYCTGSATDDCVGTTALPGRRFSFECAALADCNDSSASAWQLVLSRTDADGDNVCVGGATLDCVGTTPLPGRRFSTSCNAIGDDCNDSNIGLYRVMQTRADADNDTYCAGATANECVGATAPTGRRFAANCNTPDDCNDANGGVFRLASVRIDADLDMWCTGTATTQCIGSSPPTGQRIAGSCQGDDCRDSNAYATSTCVLSGAYTTVSRVQTCPNGPQNNLVITSTFCPQGFSLSSYSAQILSGGGNCTATGPNNITQSCNFLEGTNCRIVGDCTAN